MDIANVSVRTSLVNLYAPMGELMGASRWMEERANGYCVNVFV